MITLKKKEKKAVFWGRNNPFLTAVMAVIMGAGFLPLVLNYLQGKVLLAPMLLFCGGVILLFVFILRKKCVFENQTHVFVYGPLHHKYYYPNINGLKCIKSPFGDKKHKIYRLYYLGCESAVVSLKDPEGFIEKIKEIRPNIIVE